MQPVGFEVDIGDAVEEVQHLPANILALSPVRLQGSRDLLSPSRTTGAANDLLLHDRVDLFQQQALQPEVGDMDVSPHDLMLALNNLGIRCTLRTGGMPVPLLNRAAVARHNTVAVVVIPWGSRAVVPALWRRPLAHGTGCVVEHVPNLLEEVTHAREAGGRAPSELALAPDGGHALAEALEEHARVQVEAAREGELRHWLWVLLPS